MLWMLSWCRLSGLSVSLGVLLLDGMSRREGAYWVFLAPPSPTKEQAMHTHSLACFLSAYAKPVHTATLALT